MKTVTIFLDHIVYDQFQVGRDEDDEDIREEYELDYRPSERFLIVIEDFEDK